jgi:hypothetical protein
MDVLSIYKKPVENPADHQYAEVVLFLSPAYAGADVTPCVGSIYKWSLEEYSVPIFNTYKEAEKHAFVICFGEEDWKHYSNRE